MSQVVKISAKQKNADGETLSIEFFANMQELSKSKVLGTMLNEIFEFQKVACECKTDRFKTNSVTDIKLQLGDYEFDTEKIASGDSQVLKIFRAKMKLRNTPQGRKHFAVLVNKIITYMSRVIYDMTFEELIESLNEEILESQLTKDFAAIALN